MEHRKIILPRVLEHQSPVYSDASRNKVVVCGRRWGKTVMGLISVIEGHGGGGGALQGKLVWWLAPTYGVANLVWEQLKRSTRLAWDTKSESRRTIVLPGGGQVVVKSADNPDTLRGEGLDGVVLDEAAMYLPEVWREVIRPALSDKQGWAMFLTTPKGRNWLWEIYEQAGDQPQQWGRWQFPTSANPLIPPDEIELARHDPGMSPLAFRQEYLAEFVTPGGSVFRNEWFRYWTDEDGRMVLHDPERGEREIDVGLGMRYITVDLAASLKETADYTCFGVWLLTRQGEMILLDMVRQRLEGPDQLPLLRTLVEKWNPAYVGVERVQYQLTFIQAARRAGMPVRELHADKDKYSRAQVAASKFQAGQVYFPVSFALRHALEDELLAFSGDQKQGHDDMVDVVSYAAAEAVLRAGGFALAYGVVRCAKCDRGYMDPDNTGRACPHCHWKPVSNPSLVGASA